MASIGFEKYGIGRVLSEGNLVVPPYQRSYAWGKQNIKDFLDDIERAVTADDSEYFLGSLVLAHDNQKHPDVVDGQQRLATTAILIAAIRDHYQSLGDNRAQDIDGQYLMNRDLRTKEDVQKLKLNERDNDFFLKSILRPTTPRPEPDRESHVAIQQAYNMISERIFQKNAETGSSAFWIEVILYLLERAKVIVLKVPSNENAYVLFETLNDRGLELAISDLLKNFLLRIAGGRFSEVRDNWVAMQREFEVMGNEDAIVDFIRQYYSSKYGLTREKDLFSEIKKTITKNQGVEKQATVDFSVELLRNSRYYQMLVNSEYLAPKELPKKARKNMMTLSSLGLTRIRPLLLAVLDELPAGEIDICLRRAVSWAVRLLVSGSLGTGKVEITFCQRAKDIRDRQIQNADELSQAMESIIPTDSAFKDAFSNVVISKSKVSRYLLIALERQASGADQPELVVNEDSSELNLEHVLPQSGGADWPNFSPADVHAYCHRLGNQVLLRASENSSLGNGPFSRKRAVLGQSTLVLTKQVASERVWSPKEIKKRQEKLAELAVASWPLR
jgi:hypothetical protein